MLATTAGGETIEFDVAPEFSGTLDADGHLGIARQRVYPIG